MTFLHKYILNAIFKIYALVSRPSRREAHNRQRNLCFWSYSCYTSRNHPSWDLEGTKCWNSSHLLLVRIYYELVCSLKIFSNSLSKLWLKERHAKAKPFDVLFYSLLRKSEKYEEDDGSHDWHQPTRYIDA